MIVKIDPDEVDLYVEKANSTTQAAAGRPYSGKVRIDSMAECLDVYCSRCAGRPSPQIPYCERHPVNRLTN